MHFACNRRLDVEGNQFSAFLARTFELGESAGLQIKVSVVALEAVEPKLDCQEAPAGATGDQPPKAPKITPAAVPATTW